jgi:hypothetical protein
MRDREGVVYLDSVVISPFHFWLTRKLMTVLLFGTLVTPLYTSQAYHEATFQSLSKAE